MGGEEKREWGERGDQEAKGVKRTSIAKMARSFREELLGEGQPSPLAWRVCQQEDPTTGTEECWEMC